MEMGAAAVPPRAAGPRKYKALLPWRFRPRSVRKTVKHAAVSGSGAARGAEPQSKKLKRSASVKSIDAEDGVRPGAGGGGDSYKIGSDGIAKAFGLKGTGNISGAGIGAAAGGAGLTGGLPEVKVSGSGAAPDGGAEPQSKRFMRSASKKILDAEGGVRPRAGGGGDSDKIGSDGIARAFGLKGTGNSSGASIGAAAGGAELTGGLPEVKVSGSGAAPDGGAEPQSKRFMRSASKKILDAEDGVRPRAGGGGDSDKIGSDGIAKASGLKGTGNSSGAGIGAAAGGAELTGGLPEVKVSGAGAAHDGGAEPQSKRLMRSASTKILDVEDGVRPGAGGGYGSDKIGSDGIAEVSGLKGTGNSSGAGVGAAAGAGEECDSLKSNSCSNTRDTGGQGIGRAGCISAAGVTASCNPEGFGMNVGVEEHVPDTLNNSGVIGAGSKSNGYSASERRSEDRVQNDGGSGDSAYRTAKASDAAAKGCNSVGPGLSGKETYCRKGRKALIPWRFQVGRKRSFSKAFGFDCGSMQSPETRSCTVEDGSTQCTPATRSTVRYYASTHSGVRVSAMRDFSSVKVMESGIGYENREPNKDDHVSATARESTMLSLQNFRLIYRKLLDKEPKVRGAAGTNLGSDLQAYRIFREQFSMECDDKKYVGSVPGINVGDIFHLRVELCVVGLHRPHRLGVDYIKDDDGTCIAVSIVSYAQTSDVKNLDVLVYSGSLAVTGNQKINGAPNLALKKSMDTKTPVRVIHGFTTHLKVNFQKKKSSTYIYGGLYLVEKYWREKVSEDRYVYMFRLRRMEGQTSIDIEGILKAGKAESNYRVIMNDISHGLEAIPISVANSISDEYPMPYRYISRLLYPCNYQPAPPAGCGCVGGCSDSKRCACAVKNGGEIPFNEEGCILKAKPLVYECGPSCKCPPTCHNRVGQHGIKFRLQVFKTKTMGWGVRTLEFIPCGSFVCEYIGEVLEDEEAQKRTTDEYLFAIGHNYYDEALWEGLSTSIPALQKGPSNVDEAGFAVDASQMGNFVKFINHSCTPNLYAQNVLYDHDDITVPHIMFFACENIRPYEELAYHYNYTIDQVHDTNGNIKKKKCLCGSIECDGWLY